MEVSRTSMIHAAAPHFLWPFAVRYAAHQLNLWPRVSLLETSPTLRWTGEVGDASLFWFYHPTSHRVFPSLDVTFDDSVPFYHLFPYRSAPPPPPPLFLAPSPPSVDPLPPQGPAPSGATRGAASGGAAFRGVAFEGAESEGVETRGAGPGGAEPEGVEPEGPEPEGAEPGGAASEGAESTGAEPQGAASSRATGAGGAGAAGAGGARVAAGAGVTGSTVTTGRGGTRTRGTGAAGAGGVEGAGAEDPTESGTADADGSSAGGAGAGGVGVGGTGAGGAGVGDTRAGGAGAVAPGGAMWPRPYFSQSPLLPASSIPAPSPYPEQSGGLTERREPASRLVSPVRNSRCVPRSRPPPVLGTQAMTLRPSSVPLRVPLPAPPESSLPEVPDRESDRARAASPTVSCLLATAVKDPSFESAVASALVAELLDFAAARRLDYATALVAESASASPLSVGGECALGTNGVDYFQTFSPTPKMTTLQVLLHVAAQRDYELHSLDFSRAFVQGSLHEEIWLRRRLGFTETILATLGFAPSTADPSLFLRTNTSMPLFYILVYIDDLVFATADIEALTLVKSELQKRHTCTDLGELRSYLGLQITRDRAWCTIILTLSHMVHHALQRFGFQFSSPQPTPLSTSHSLSAPPSDESVEPSGPYPELVGCLILICFLDWSCDHLFSPTLPMGDLVSHLRASNARYRAAVPTEFLDKNQPPKFITLYFIVTRLPDSLRSVRDHFLSLDPTSLTGDLLEQHLLAAETSAVAVGAALGTPRPPFFEGCSPFPVAPSYTFAAAADVSVAEDVGAAFASSKPRSGKGKGGKGGGGGSGGDGGGSRSSGGGSSGGGGGGGTGGWSGSSGGGSGGSGGSGGGGGSGTAQTLAPCLLAGDLAHTALDGGGRRCVGVLVLGILCLCSRYVRDKLSPRAIPCVFLGFVPDAPGWQFYHPTSRRVFPSQDVTFDDSVPFYHLFPYRSAPPPPPPLFLAPCPPPIDSLPPRGRAPSGVSKVDPLPGPAPVQIAVDSGATRGAASRGAAFRGAAFGGAASGGAESEGVETRGAGPGGAEPEGVELEGLEPEGAEVGGAASEGAESRGAEPQGAASSRDSAASGAGGAGAAGAGGARVAGGAGVTGGTVTTGPGGARTRVGGTDAGGAGVGDTRAGGAGAVALGGAVRPRPYFVPLLQQSSGRTECREPASRLVSRVRNSRCVPRLRPPPVLGTQGMTLCPSSVPLRVPLPAPPASSLREVPDPETNSARAASPTVSRLLATAVTDPLFESAAAFALFAELLEFAGAYRLDYATALVAESASASPPSVGGECALGTDVLEDRQEEFECLGEGEQRSFMVVYVDDIFHFLTLL
ncbi:unnamed protein product [Closterium sp. NIES-53]